jgi:hypothetical protein
VLSSEIHVCDITAAVTAQEDAAAALESLRAAVNAFTRTWCADYLWHIDSLALQLWMPPEGGFAFAVSASSNSHTARHGGVDGAVNEEEHGCAAVPHLWCSMRFGECVLDEWFVVWLVFQITQSFADASASVVDADGEFLLIEAAMQLPAWASPETTASRVWIRGGKLHLIPPPRRFARPA